MFQPWNRIHINITTFDIAGSHSQPPNKKNHKVPFSGSHRGWIRTIDLVLRAFALHGPRSDQLSYTVKYTSACPRHPDRIAALVADVKDKKFFSNLAIF